MMESIKMSIASRGTLRFVSARTSPLDLPLTTFAPGCASFRGPLRDWERPSFGFAGTTSLDLLLPILAADRDASR